MKDAIQPTHLLTLPRLAKLGFGLAVLFVVAFVFENWKILLLLLDTTPGAQAAALGAQLRVPVASFIVVAVLFAVLGRALFFRPGKPTRVVPEDDLRNAYDDSLSYGINPRNGLPLDQPASDESANAVTRR